MKSIDFGYEATIYSHPSFVQMCTVHSMLMEVDIFKAIEAFIKTHLINVHCFVALSVETHRSVEILGDAAASETVISLQSFFPDQNASTHALG